MHPMRSNNHHLHFDAVTAFRSQGSLQPIHHVSLFATALWTTSRARIAPVIPGPTGQPKSVRPRAIYACYCYRLNTERRPTPKFEATNKSANLVSSLEFECPPPSSCLLLGRHRMDPFSETLNFNREKYLTTIIFNSFSST